MERSIIHVNSVCAIVQRQQLAGECLSEILSYLRQARSGSPAQITTQALPPLGLLWDEWFRYGTRSTRNLETERPEPLHVSWAPLAGLGD
jgi:hypothetical protein